MSVLLAVEVAVIVAAFFGMLWLRRESDEAWRRRQIMLRLAPIRRAFIDMQIVVRDRFTPALAEAAAAVARMGEAMRKAGIR